MRPGLSRLVHLVLALALVEGATACTSTGELGSQTDTTVEVRPGGTLTFATTQKINGFNQSSPRSASLTLADVMFKVWPSAFTDSPKGAVLNRDLLESAELTSSDPQTVVYRINPEATWSDGDPIDANDFVYLWRTAYTPGAKDLDGSPVATTRPHRAPERSRGGWPDDHAAVTGAMNLEGGPPASQRVRRTTGWRWWRAS